MQRGRFLKVGLGLVHAGWQDLARTARQPQLRRVRVHPDHHDEGKRWLMTEVIYQMAKVSYFRRAGVASMLI